MALAIEEMAFCTRLHSALCHLWGRPELQRDRLTRSPRERGESSSQEVADQPDRSVRDGASVLYGPDAAGRRE